VSGTIRTDAKSSPLIFRLATAPAQLLARYRQDLRATLALDAARYSGGVAAGVFVVLAAVAVGYPMVASVVHAISAPTIAGDPLPLALRPFFEDVYSESLPFMIAVAGIGAFSPALGVLMILVFIPADLIAASSAAPPELLKLSWQTHPEPIFARFISYGLLWILAVEIPILARRWALGAGARGGQSRSVRAIVTLLAGTAVLVFFWARALPWLIQPVFDWSAMQLITPQASAPTWFYWPVLVIGAAAIAGITAVWPPPALPTLAAPQASVDEVPGSPMPLWRVLLRQTIAMLVLAALLAGLLTTLREAAVLVAGLLVAGPVLTLLLPRLPVPAAVRRVPLVARWITAMVISLAVSFLIESVAGDALYEGYFVIVLTLATVAPLFRLLLEAGGPREALGGHAARGGPPPAIVTSALVLLGLALWLAVPAVALANNCPSLAQDEIGDCIKKTFDASLLLIGSALAAMGGALLYFKKVLTDPRNSPFFGPPDYSDNWPPTPEIDPAKFKNPPHGERDPSGHRRK
jgi:hypothetical protein